MPFTLRWISKSPVSGSPKTAPCSSQGPTAIHSELIEGELCPSALTDLWLCSWKKLRLWCFTALNFPAFLVQHTQSAVGYVLKPGRSQSGVAVTCLILPNSCTQVHLKLVGNIMHSINVMPATWCIIKLIQVWKTSKGGKLVSQQVVCWKWGRSSEKTKTQMIEKCTSFLKMPCWRA